MSKLLEGCKILCIFLLLMLTFLFFDVEAACAHTPHDVIDVLEISPNYNQDKALFIVVRNNLLRSKDGGHSWKRIVRGLENKHILSSLVISSHSNTSLFLSSSGDGIYKSIDEGDSWFEVNNGLGSLNINVLAISPSYSIDKVVLAAGTQKGLYKTRNGGESWYQVINDDIKVTAIAPLRENNDQIIIGDQKGVLYLSTDGGELWRQHSQILNSGAITAISVSPNFSIDGTFFVGTEKGVFRTVDRGISFLEADEGILDKSIISLVTSPRYATNSTIFASTWHQAVFQSNNGGNTWKKYNKGVTSNSQADSYKVPYFKDLRISKTFENNETIFLGGFDGLFKSTNGGHAWEQMDTLPLRLIIGLALSPEYKDDATVAITTYVGGAYITDNKGNTWTAINKGLKKKRLGDLVFSPNYHVDNTIFTYAKNQLLKSTNKGKSWDEIRINDEYWGLSKLINFALNGVSRWLPKGVSNVFKPFVAQDYPTMLAISPGFASDQTIYFGTRAGNIFRLVGEGKCSAVWDGIGKEVTSLVISPNFLSDKTLYASVPRGAGIYKTVNAGNTWLPVNSGLAVSLNEDVNLAISPHYKVDKTVFAGTAEGLLKTTDAGENWIKLAGYAYGGDGNIEVVAVSPNYQNDETLIISVKGRGLFKSADGGTTFNQIAKDLINNNNPLSNMELFPPASVPIKFSPSYSIDNTIYGSSAEEIFQSTDGGNTWKTITTSSRYQDRRGSVLERLLQPSRELVVGVMIATVAALIGMSTYYFFKRRLKRS